MANESPEALWKCIDKRIHEPARLGLIAELVRAPHRLAFTYLRDSLGLTQGNLASHLKALEEAGYISVARSGAPADSATYIRLTERGREALVEYLEALGRLVGRLS